MRGIWLQASSDVLHAQLKIRYQDLPLLYKAIKQDIYDSEERKLSIFVSVLEPDSVCALRILQARPPLCTLDLYHAIASELDAYQRELPRLFRRAASADMIELITI